MEGLNQPASAGFVGIARGFIPARGRRTRKTPGQPARACPHTRPDVNVRAIFTKPTEVG
ncbi:MAG: hypothetical protein IT311_11545 [Anaerolineales bacterium]|nr:hypothetical protein [Anaerolineales bacterium]